MKFHMYLIRQAFLILSIRKKGLNTHPLIQFVKKALAVLEEQMSYDSVMAFLRNPYVVSDENTFDGDILCEDLDRLDNYLLAGGIERINRWKHPWVMPYDNADEEDLSRLPRQEGYCSRHAADSHRHNS